MGFLAESLCGTLHVQFPGLKWELAIYTSNPPTLGFPWTPPPSSYHLPGGHAQCPSLEGFNLVPSRSSRKHYCPLKCRLLTIQPCFFLFCYGSTGSHTIPYALLNTRRYVSSSSSQNDSTRASPALSFAFTERDLREASSSPEAVCRGGKRHKTHHILKVLSKNILVLETF